MIPIDVLVFLRLSYFIYWADGAVVKVHIGESELTISMPFGAHLVTWMANRVGYGTEISRKSGSSQVMC